MTFIRITPAQRDLLRGTYDDGRHALEPIPLFGTTDYILTDAVLSHPAFAPVLATLQQATQYPAWTVGVAYTVGTVVEHEGRLWRCVQAHTAQSDWSPPVVPALWMTAHRPGEIPAWVQPLGAHDAYALGALVTYQGQVWRSTITANVWPPGTASLWVVVE